MHEIQGINLTTKGSILLCILCDKLKIKTGLYKILSLYGRTCYTRRPICRGCLKRYPIIRPN
jgi:hypothetical protein